jgi:hypothetical protein
MRILLLFAFLRAASSLQAASPLQAASSLQTASIGEPLRSGCSLQNGQIGIVSPSDRMTVLLSVAGSDTPCYKIMVSHPDGDLTGYVLGSSLPAIGDFDRQREEASIATDEAQARLTLELAAPKSAVTEPDKPQDPSVSTQFKDFSGRDSHGKFISLAGLGGRVTLVTFWSPKSPESQTDLLRAMPLYYQFYKKGLAVVGISMDPRGNRIDDALGDKVPPWPEIPDQSGLAAHYHVDPRAGKTFVLDASHKVVAAGPMGPAIEEAVRQLLAEP